MARAPHSTHQHKMAVNDCTCTFAAIDCACAGHCKKFTQPPMIDAVLYDSFVLFGFFYLVYTEVTVMVNKNEGKMKGAEKAIVN